MEGGELSPRNQLPYIDENVLYAQDLDMWTIRPGVPRPARSARCGHLGLAGDGL